MAILVTFTPTSMTTDQYEQVIRQLTAAGAGSPAGRLFHVAAGSGSSLQVVDVWESLETFESFGQTLMPILQQVGITVPIPEIREIHHIITGSTGLPLPTAP